MKLHLEVGDKVRALGICFKQRREKYYKQDPLKFYRDMAKFAGHVGVVDWINPIDKWYSPMNPAPSEEAKEVDGINYVIKFKNGTYHGFNRGEIIHLPTRSFLHQEWMEIKKEFAPLWKRVKEYVMREWEDAKEQLNY